MRISKNNKAYKLVCKTSRFLYQIGIFSILALSITSTVFATTVDVKSYGAKGDGTSDDTVAIQAAVDAVKDNGGTIVFPSGTYIVGQVNVTGGLTLKTKDGEATTAVIKTKNYAGAWNRCFTTQASGYMHNDSTDSAPLNFSNLDFDGNLANQGAYIQYELEHQAAIFVMANINNTGKLIVNISDCNFKDGVAGAMAIYTNTIATINNCTATDYFKGAVVAVGDGGEIYISDLTTDGNLHRTGINIEPEGASELYIEAENMDINGCLDIKLINGSTFIGENIKVRRGPFFLYSRDSTMEFLDSEFHAGAKSTSHIYYPHNVKFDNCDFFALRESSDTAVEYSAAFVYFNLGTAAEEDQKLTFKKCRFKMDSGFLSTDTVYAVYNNSSKNALNNVIELQDCTIDSGYDYGIYVKQGGILRAVNVSTAADTGVFLGATNSYADYYFDAVLDNVSFESGTTVAERLNWDHSNNKMCHKNMTIDDSYNTLETQNGLTDNTYSGGRLILGAAAPSNCPGLVGDVYQIEADGGLGSAWLCTTSSQAAAVWTSLQKLSFSYSYSVDPANDFSLVKLNNNSVTQGTYWIIGDLADGGDIICDLGSVQDIAAVELLSQTGAAYRPMPASTIYVGDGTTWTEVGDTARVYGPVLEQRLASNINMSGRYIKITLESYAGYYMYLGEINIYQE